MTITTTPIVSNVLHTTQIAAEKAAKEAALKAAEEAKTEEELARERAEAEAAAMINYRALNTDKLREECKALGVTIAFKPIQVQTLPQSSFA